MRSLNVISSENVEHLISGREQIVRDNSAMTSPPNRLCAHNGTPLGMAQFTQSHQAGLKILAHRVISVIVEAGVLPKSVHRWWHRCALSPETPELCDVLVIYPKLRQRYWEHVPIELWIGA